MKKIFIDGSSGTTGLRIRERLSERKDLEMISVPYDLRHEESVRKKAMEEADIVFLCLPDDAARVSAALCPADTVLIDTSTAHRTDPSWVYGLSELEGQKEKISGAKRIANPGCHASGFIALVQPLVKNGLIREDAGLSCFSLTGYSGGGKKMIAQYESDPDPLLKGPRMYGLSQQHKHLPEMRIISGLKYDPVFCPVVADFYSGMETVVSLFARDVNGSVQDIRNLYEKIYADGLIRFAKNAGENGFLSAAAMSGRDDMEISVSGNDERILLTARFDNLGKGASGAAIQNMNLVIGAPDTEGLMIGGIG